jgi:hypothetical protein
VDLCDAQDLIDGEGEQAEHQMAARLGGAAHAQESAAELVFEPGMVRKL